MVSNLDFLEPVYGISKKQIISIDTTSDGYQPLYIVKYRVNK